MNSSMVWNGATRRLLSARGLSFFILFFFSLSHEGWAQPLRQKLKGWTAQSLAAASLEIQQRVLLHRADRKAEALNRLYQELYLEKMGWPRKITNPSLAFRGLLTRGEDAKSVRAALGKIDSKKASSFSSDLDLLAHLYGGADLVDGVVVIGKKPLPLEAIRSVLGTLCEQPRPCRFWDPRLLAKVALLPVSGIALFEPEVAGLRVSRDLFQSPSPLQQVVVIHEMAHVAAWSENLATGTQWTKAFQKFSGWEHTKQGWESPVRPMEGQWEDELTKQSLGSPYSLFPDPPTVATEAAGRKLDGFVFFKAVRETQKANDPEEDFADHVAAFVAAPHRYCYKGRPVAPRKYAWIARHVFGKPAELKCGGE